MVALGLFCTHGKRARPMARPRTTTVQFSKRKRRAPVHSTISTLSHAASASALPGGTETGPIQYEFATGPGLFPSCANSVAVASCPVAVSRPTARPRTTHRIKLSQPTPLSPHPTWTLRAPPARIAGLQLGTELDAFASARSFFTQGWQQLSHSSA